MSKSGKNTGIFFLWMAGLIILLHIIISHHHHFDTYFSHYNRSAQTIPSQGNGAEDSPLHCHAFNDSLIDKIYNIAVETPDIQYINLFSFAISEPLLSYNDSENTFYLSIDIIPQGQFVRSCFALRAPPPQA